MPKGRYQNHRHVFGPSRKDWVAQSTTMYDPRDLTRTFIRSSKEVVIDIQENTDNSMIWTDSGDVKPKLDITRDIQRNGVDRTALRPKPKVCFFEQYSQCGSSSASNILVQKQKTEESFNHVILEHFKVKQGKCSGKLYIDDKLSEKPGTVLAAVARCPDCDYVLAKYKLYDEVQSDNRGRKAAIPSGTCTPWHLQYWYEGHFCFSEHISTFKLRDAANSQ